MIETSLSANYNITPKPLMRNLSKRYTPRDWI
jgi:hypothetical protein